MPDEHVKGTLSKARGKVEEALGKVTGTGRTGPRQSPGRPRAMPRRASPRSRTPSEGRGTSPDLGLAFWYATPASSNRSMR